MVRKIVLLVVFSISFLGCDEDFKQGNCDEGFFQQSTGDGNTHCVPITDSDAVNDTISEVDDLIETN